MGNTQSSKQKNWTRVRKQIEQYPGAPMIVTNLNGQLAHLYDVQIPEQCSINEELKSYELRKSSVSGHVCQVYDTTPKQRIFQCSGPKKAISVVTEYIPIRLSQHEHLSIIQGVYVLEGALSGFKEIQEQMNCFFLVKDKMIGFDQVGKIKVWINEDFSINQFPKDKTTLSSQDKMIKELISCVQSKTSGNKELEKILGEKGMESFVMGRNQCSAYLALHDRQTIGKSLLPLKSDQAHGQTASYSQQKFITNTKSEIITVGRDRLQYSSPSTRPFSPFQKAIKYGPREKENLSNSAHSRQSSLSHVEPVISTKKSLPSPVIQEQRIPLFIRQREEAKLKPQPIKVLIVSPSPQNKKFTSPKKIVMKTPLQVEPSPLQNTKKKCQISQKKNHLQKNMNNTDKKSLVFGVSSKHNLPEDPHPFNSPNHSKKLSSKPDMNNYKEKKIVTNYNPNSSPITIKVFPKQKTHDNQKLQKPQSRRVRIYTKQLRANPVAHFSFQSPPHLASGISPRISSKTQAFQTKNQIKSISFYEEPKSDNNIFHQIKAKPPAFISEKRKDFRNISQPILEKKKNPQSKTFIKREFISKTTEIAIPPPITQPIFHSQPFDEYENRSLTGIQQQYKNQFLNSQNQITLGNNESNSPQLQKKEETLDNKQIDKQINIHSVFKESYVNSHFDLQLVNQTISSRSQSEATLEHHKSIKPSRFKSDLGQEQDSQESNQQIQTPRLAPSQDSQYRNFKTIFAKLLPPEFIESRESQFQKIQQNFKKSKQIHTTDLAFASPMQKKDLQAKDSSQISSPGISSEGIKFEVNQESAKKLANLIAESEESIFEQNEEGEDILNQSDDPRMKKSQIYESALEPFVDYTAVRN